MREFNITSAKLTGSPGSSGWSQVHDFTPQDAEKYALRGRLFAVIAVKKTVEEEDVETLNTGREVLARLHEEYFGKVDISIFNGLKRALEVVFNEFGEKLEGLEIAAAVILGDTVYSAAFGGAQVLIFRDAMVAPILKSRGQEVVAASGHPKEGDSLLLLTSSFAQTVSDVKIKEALGSGSPQESVDSLAPLVHSKEEAGGIAVAILSFGEKTDLIPEIAPENEPEVIAQEPTEEKMDVPGGEKSPILAALGKYTKDASRFLKEKMGERRLYVKKDQIDVEEAQKKKTAVSVGVALLLLLLISIFFGIRQRSLGEARSKYEPRLLEAQHQLEEARNLFSINPERARELFSESTNTAEELTGEGVKDERLTKLLEEIEKSRQEILGEFRAPLELFIDLSILADGLTADALVAGSEYAHILDKTGRRIVEIALDTKRTEVVAGPTQIGSGATSIASYTQRAFVLEGDGIFEVKNQRNLVIEEEWEGDVLIYAYAGNMYVLDKGSSEILRYAGTDSGFGSSSDWLAPGVEPDLSNVISWTIDGSIWILTSTGVIEKYTTGNSQNLDLTISPALENPTAIYTNEENQYVYVLDSARGRVVVFDKEGVYKAQYIAEELKEAKGVIASETEGKIIFLVGERLLFLEIKH